MIEKIFDVPFISDLASMKNRSSRITARLSLCINVLPDAPELCSVLSEFAAGSIKENFYKTHNLKGLNIADPSWVVEPRI